MSDSGFWIQSDPILFDLDLSAKKKNRNTVLGIGTTRCAKGNLAACLSDYYPQQLDCHSYKLATSKMSSADIKASFVVKAGLARMLKGGVIMDVINVEQAKIAEAAGAVAVMALERIPADIRYDGGVARMSDPEMIREIQAAVTIPVMAKVSLQIIDF